MSLGIIIEGKSESGIFTDNCDFIEHMETADCAKKVIETNFYGKARFLVHGAIIFNFY